MTGLVVVYWRNCPRLRVEVLLDRERDERRLVKALRMSFFLPG